MLCPLSAATVLTQHPREANADELVWPGDRTLMLLITSAEVDSSWPPTTLPQEAKQGLHTRTYAWPAGTDTPGQARTALTVCRLLERSSRRAVAEVLRGMQGEALAARGSVPPPLAPKPGIAAGAAERGRSGDAAPGHVVAGLES